MPTSTAPDHRLQENAQRPQLDLDRQPPSDPRDAPQDCAPFDLNTEPVGNGTVKAVFANAPDEEINTHGSER